MVNISTRNVLAENNFFEKGHVSHESESQLCARFELASLARAIDSLVPRPI